jgi:integrase
MRSLKAKFIYFCYVRREKARDKKSPLLHKDNATIYVRFSSDGKRIEKPTDLIVPNTRYLVDGEIKNPDSFPGGASLKARLSKLKGEIDTAIAKRLYDDEIKREDKFTGEWLTAILDEFHQRPPKQDDRNLLSTVLQKYHDYKKADKKNPVTDGTLKTYRTTIARVNDFQNDKKHYLVNQVDGKFANDFLEWGEEEEFKKVTLVKSLRQIKSALKWASQNKHKVNPDFLSMEFKMPKGQQEIINNKTVKVKKLVFTLTPQEIKKIADYKGSEIENTVRDWFLIGYWTAARASDFLAFTMDDIESTIDGKILRYTQQKTSMEATPFLHSNVLELLDKRNGFPPKVAYHEFMKEIQAIGKKVGLTKPTLGEKRVKIERPDKKNITRRIKGTYLQCELIGSHTCRRSWCTNHYQKLDVVELMKQTGHTSSDMFFEYIGKPPPGRMTGIKEMFKADDLISKASNT